MVFISEWLPNPAGSDTKSEWIELFNSGAESVSLQGWVLKTKSGKHFTFPYSEIRANAYLVLKRPETKLAFNNQDEAVFLYDPGGKLVDESKFSGTAPENKSFARINFAEAAKGNQNFIFGEPTPGQPNKIGDTQNFLIHTKYPLDQPLNSSLGYFELITVAVISAFLFSLCVTFLLKRNDYLSKLFFGRD